MEIYQKLKDQPLIQAVICIVLMSCFEIFFFLTNFFKFSWVEVSDIWLIGTSLVLFYIILNTILGFGSRDMMRYYKDSIYGFLLVTSFMVFSGKWLTGKSIFEVKTYSWIIFVFVIVYLVFLSIQSLMRKIVSIALKQDKKIQDEQ
ncbi:MAG: hypothetical protein JNK69_12980 [Saprospiraceae bacterium]|nr:hypothetical protein [Candidatus Vicinibacter proximus]MBL7824314.1 hypothetical protein [Saprospiraceae bacterium]MCC6843578.1 hypothetical protein [Saprospiraceae bacterium]HRG31701.1 hypothetical protein [Saprospiraceae bacterium]